MHNDINYLYLKEHKVLEGLSRDELHEVLNHCKFTRKKKSEVIRMSEDTTTNLYFLVKGKVKISEMDISGNSLIKEVEKEGGFFGKFGITSGHNYEFAQALTNEVVYFSLSSSYVKILCQKIPMLAFNLSLAMNDKLERSEKKYSHLVFQDVKTRLVHFFKYWAREEGTKEGSKVVISNYLTHNDIAGIISTCRQTVTSILNELKSEGYISYSRKEIIIPDLSQLEKAA